MSAVGVMDQCGRFATARRAGGVSPLIPEVIWGLTPPARLSIFRAGVIWISAEPQLEPTPPVAGLPRAPGRQRPQERVERPQAPVPRPQAPVPRKRAVPPRSAAAPRRH